MRLFIDRDLGKQYGYALRAVNVTLFAAVLWYQWAPRDLAA